MPTVIPVKFKYAARDLWFDPQETGAVEADHVICSTERGTEIGIVTADATEVSEEERRAMCGDAALKPVLRIATDEDLDRADALAEKGDEAMPIFRQLVTRSGLDMKPVGVEYLFGGERVVCYFSAEERVDFRIEVKEKSRSTTRFKAIAEGETASNLTPKWLERNENLLGGKVVAAPQREDIDFPVEEHLIVELYSK